MATTRPNDLPDMILGETRSVSFSWATNSGTLTGATVSAQPSNITFGTVSTSEQDATVLVTPSQAGTYWISATGTLSNGETIILPVRLKVTDAACNIASGDYE